jgi:hypothetical protein
MLQCVRDSWQSFMSGFGVAAQPPALAALDAWIGAQVEPQASRAETLRPAGARQAQEAIDRCHAARRRDDLRGT